MRIKQKFQEKNVVFSFEIFPPKSTSPIATIFDTIEELSVLQPDYISVTYGAGGSAQNNRTSELSHLIQTKYEQTALAHLTCIGASKLELNDTLEDLKSKGVMNILALRGDLTEDGLGELKTSQELIRYLKAMDCFDIAAACYPEGHIESGKNVDYDLQVLKWKEEAGADYYITQLFFDNNRFYDFLDKANKLGIQGPIQAGIMPIINKKQVKRVISLSGASLPQKFLRVIDRYEHDPLALRDAGIAFALEQIVDLISSGVRGIHLYTMNNPYLAKSIKNNLNFLLGSTNRKQVVDL